MPLKANQLKSGVILSYISKIIQIVIGILYTPLMIRLLGQSEYGLYNIAASIISYLGVLNFGFGSAYMRFYSRFKVNEDENQVANLNGMFIEIFGVLGLLAAIAGIILAFNVELIFGPSLNSRELAIAKILILILVVNLAISFLTVVFTTYLQANEKFIEQNILVIINQITAPLVSLPLLLMGYGSIGMVLGTTIVHIIINIATMVYAIKKLDMKIAFDHFDRSLFKEMSSFSFFIFINLVVDQINNNVDKTILGRYQGTTSVAIYSVGANLNTYYTQLSTTISTVFTPRVHRMEARNVSNYEMTALFSRVGRIQFILLSFICLGFISFGKPFIYFWVGSGYEDSYYVALILMCTIIIPLIQNLSIEIQRAKNKHQFRSWLYIFMAIGNIIISIPLSQKYGAIGATIGTSFSYLLGNGIIMNWYNKNKIGLDILQFWKEILKFIPSFIVPSIYGIFTNKLINLNIFTNFIICGFLYIIIFGISIWLFGLNDYEKRLFKSPFK
ncbi:lipopolysaccharide biosynthesis protein [Aerococcus urinaeequi]|uniref:lipopolysaccharide biosynthesis protein n=1 Tax=Aerococcus urinaeequi TaxID=51665 RepID=UPI003D6A1B21